jgi:hypothetical protein
MSSFSLLQNSLNRKNNKQTIELLKLGIKSEMNKLSENQINSIVSGGGISKLLKNNSYSNQEMSRLWEIYLKIIKESKTLTKEENKQCDELQEQINKCKSDLDEARDKALAKEASTASTASSASSASSTSSISHKLQLLLFKLEGKYLNEFNDKYIKEPYARMTLALIKYANSTGADKNYYELIESDTKFLEYNRMFGALQSIIKEFTPISIDQENLFIDMYNYTIIQFLKDKSLNTDKINDIIVPSQNELFNKLKILFPLG